MLRSLNIRKRLSVVYGLFALVIVVIGGFGAYSMKSVEERFQL